MVACNQKTMWGTGKGEFQHHLDMEDMERWGNQDRMAAADAEFQGF